LTYQIAALVLAGLPTTRTLMDFFATWSMAPPWTLIASQINVESLVKNQNALENLKYINILA